MGSANPPSRLVMEGPGSGGKPPVKLSFDDRSWQRIVELDQRPRYVR
jgi:hypothetical protein